MVGAAHIWVLGEGVEFSRFETIMPKRDHKKRSCLVQTNDQHHVVFSKANLFVIASIVSLFAPAASTASCQTLPNKRCHQDGSCQRDSTLEICKPVSDQPSRQPSGSHGGESNRLLFKSKKLCCQDAYCQWNSDFEVCIDVLIEQQPN
jgi:hypothetical protein